MQKVIIVVFILILFGCSTPGTIETIYYKFKEREDAIYKKDFGRANQLENEIAWLATQNKETLLQKSKSPDISSRITVISALGFIADKNAIPQIVPFLIEALNDPNSEIRRASAGSLGMLAYEETPIDTFKELIKDPDPSIRTAITYAISRILRPGNDRGLFELLIKALDDGYGEVRNNAVLSLGVIGKKEAIQPIIDKVLKDKFPFVRESVAQTLGKFKDPNVTPYLIELLRDDSADVVRSSAWSLKEINGKDFGRSYNKWREWWEEEEKRRSEEKKPQTTPPGKKEEQTPPEKKNGK